MIEDIKVYIKENVPCGHKDGGDAPRTVSTVGVKLQYRGQWYGDYKAFPTGTVDAETATNTVNAILSELLMKVKAKGEEKI